MAAYSDIAIYNVAETFHRFFFNYFSNVLQKYFKNIVKDNFLCFSHEQYAAPPQAEHGRVLLLINKRKTQDRIKNAARIFPSNFRSNKMIP